jgi:hypothetical protein
MGLRNLFKYLLRQARREPQEGPLEEPVEPDLDDECRKSPLICIATYDDC